MGGLKNSHLLFTGLETGNSRSKHQQIKFLVRALFLTCSALLLDLHVTFSWCLFMEDDQDFFLFLPLPLAPLFSPPPPSSTNSTVMIHQSSSRLYFQLSLHWGLGLQV